MLLHGLYLSTHETKLNLFYTTGKLNGRPTGQHTTHKHYDRLQSLTDDDSLITTVEKQHNHQSYTPQAHRAKITDIVVASSHKIPAKWRKKTKQRFVKNKSKAKSQRNGRSKNWLGRVFADNVKSRKVIRRKSRDDGTYDENGEDDEKIQSKDEDDDEDVQLIIIPRKPQKHLPPKVDESDNEEFQKSDRLNDDSENYENSKSSRKDSKKPSDISKSIRQRLKNSDDDDGKNIKTKLKNTDDDATLTLETDASDDGQGDSKNNHKSNAGNYDLHLKVKDRSGSHVKLSGDLPGNIENIMAVGEDGGKVQIHNTRTKPSQDFKLVNSQDGNDDASTDEMAQNLIKMKSGKLKHSPYPSTILLNSDRSVNEHPKLASEGNSNQEPVPLKTQENKQPQALSSDTLTSLTRGEANAKAEQPSNQQPSNNIFAPMEFENGDDELMATSRLLDIAQKADDASSLKEIKDPSNTVKERPKETLKDLTKG